jgi:hypothetical protein
MLKSCSDVRGDIIVAGKPYERVDARGVTEITQIGPTERHPSKSVRSVTRRDCDTKLLTGIDIASLVGRRFAGALTPSCLGPPSQIVRKFGK